MPGSPIRPRCSSPTYSPWRRHSAGTPARGDAGILGPAAELLQPGSHGSTFGGNPVSCAAALAVLDTIVADDLLRRAKHIDAFVADGIAALGHPLYTGVRGEGALLVITLAEPHAAEVETALRAAGFLVNAVAPDAIRLAPPLVVSDDQLGAFLDALEAIIPRSDT